MTQCERLGLLEQFSDFSLQGETLFLPKIGESKRLQIALRSPDRKQHGRFASYRAGAQMHSQADGDSLVEAGGQFEQPSSNRNPEHLGPELASIFELNRRGSGSPQVNARGADFSSGVGEVGHYKFNYVTELDAVHITKAGPQDRIQEMESVQQLS